MPGNGELRARKFLTGLLAAGALVGAYCFATAGVSALLMTAIDMPAQARGGHGHGGRGGHWGGGGHWHGGGWGRGHYWHGRWWGPGIGPCWRLTPVGWIWVCG